MQERIIWVEDFQFESAKVERTLVSSNDFLSADPLQF